jgi:hypothetical protein
MATLTSLISPQRKREAESRRRPRAPVDISPEEAFERYAAQDWERSIRRLARELNRSPSGLFHWSVRYHWIERVALIDQQAGRGVFNRRAWRREMRKTAKWTSDSRFWSRADRRRWQHAANSSKAARARWGTTTQPPEELRAFARAKSRHLRWLMDRDGIQETTSQIGKRRGTPPLFLGSA